MTESNAFTSLFVLAFLGCAHTPGSLPHVQSLDGDELRKAPIEDLCSAYAAHRHGRFTLRNFESVSKAIRDRDAIERSEWPLIEAKQIRIGMSEVSLLCSWGRQTNLYHPSSHTERTIDGTATIWRYTGGFSWFQHTTDLVTVKNGVVVKWEHFGD